MDILARVLSPLAEVSTIMASRDPFDLPTIYCTVLHVPGQTSIEVESYSQTFLSKWNQCLQEHIRYDVLRFPYKLNHLQNVISQNRNYCFLQCLQPAYNSSDNLMVILNWETLNYKTFAMGDFKSSFLAFPKLHDYPFLGQVCSIEHLFIWLESQAYLWSHVPKT